MVRRNHVSGQTGITGSNPVLTTKIEWMMQLRRLKMRGERCTQPTVIQ